MPSGDSNFKHPEPYSVFIPLYFWRGVELSAHTSNQKTRKKIIRHTDKETLEGRRLAAQTSSFFGAKANN